MNTSIFIVDYSCIIRSLLLSAVAVGFLLLVPGAVCADDASEQTQADELPNFDALWDYRDPAATEKAFLALLPRAERAGNGAYHLALLTQIARTQGLQMKFEEAHKTLDQVEQALVGKESDVSLATVLVRYLLERGRVFNSAGHKDKARPLFLSAWEQGNSAKLDFYAVDAAHMLGIIEPAEKALAWNEKAMDLAEKSTDKRAKGWIGSLSNNIGWTWFDMKDYEKAMTMFRKNRAWNEEHAQTYSEQLARYAIAKTLRMQGKLDDALDMQTTLAREFEKAGAAPDGYVYEEIAECLLAMGKTEAAVEPLNKAYRLLSNDQWLVQNEPDRLKRLRELAGVATESSNTAEHTP